MRKKVPLEVKLEALKLLQSGNAANAVSKQYRISDGELKTWSLIYEKEGKKGLAAYPKNVCTDDIKHKIICAYDGKSVPLHTLSAKYSVPYSSVSRCVSTYKRKGWSGVEGAVIDMMEVMRSGDSWEEALTKAELKNKLKVAMNELEYLRAENALLKKNKGLNGSGRAQEKACAQAIQSLRPRHALKRLLRASGMARAICNRNC